MNRQDIFREPKVEKTVETSDREEAKEK